ncbi:MAG: LysM peptidoglycan-binding domain-containing protein [Lachnospiraceae bacterium]|nr:LysM peptidoglycan-binding domain-containing protein [Lachnospiraceae bacterium]
MQIEYSSFFPKQWGSYCDVSEGQLLEPNKYKEMIEELRDNENYFLVRITELKISKYCKIKNCDFAIENGVGDISYTIQLEEYNKLQESKSVYIPPVSITDVTPVTSMSSTNLTGSPRSEKAVTSQYYTVRDGDNLYIIARKFNMEAKNLYFDNKSVLGQSYEVKAGMQLKVRGTTDSSGRKILKLGSGRTVTLNHS